MKWTTEAKVGGFTLVGLLIFGMALLFLNRISLFEAPQIELKGDFKTVTGLKVGNAVKYSGVSIGKVKDFSVAPDGVVVTMQVDKDIKIPQDSSFSLANDGMLGDKFIQIKPGSSQVLLKDGSRVKGEGDSEIDKTLETANQMMMEANKLLASINGIIGDEQTQHSLRNALRTSEQIVNNTAALTGQMNQMVAANSQNVQVLTSNMVVITENMKSLTAQMDKALHDINGDGQAAGNLRTILANMKNTTDSVSKMAQSLEGVVTDPQTSQDLKTTLHNTAEISNKINSFTGGSGGLGNIKGQANGEVLYNTTKKEYDPNFNYRLFMGENLFELGANHIGNGTTVDLNYGKEIGKNFYVRGGLFEGQLGLGIAYGLRGPVALSAAVYDPNDVTYKIRGDIKLFDDTYAVMQWIAPFSSPYGGAFYGIRHVF